MNDTKNQPPKKEDLENTASVAPSMDEVSKGRIEALARKSKFYGWEVSKKQILRVGPEEFEKHLTKQRKIIHKLRIVEQKAKLISLRFTFPALPLSSKDADVFAKRVNGALRKIYKTIPTPKTETPAETVETETLDFPQQTAAEKLEMSIHQRLEECEISVEFGDLSELVEQAAEQFYLYDLHEDLKQRATAINHAYIEPIFPATKDALDEVQQEIFEAEILHDINQRSAFAKELTGWTPNPPKFDATLSEKERHLFYIQKQLAQYQEFEKKLSILPSKSQERFEITRPPYNNKNIEIANRDIDNYIRIEKNKIADRKRMFALVRFGFILILLTSLVTQQFMKYYEIADLQLRGSKIGLRIKAPLFPYLDREVEALRWFIEQQEEYSIIADQIKMEGAIRGLNISLRKPYDGNELQMWNKAISNFNMKTVFKGSFSMGSIYGERDERPVHKVKISYDFEMMSTEVSQALYRAIMKENPSTIPNCTEKEIEILREGNNINSTAMARSIAQMEQFKEERKNNIHLSCPVDNVSWVDAIRFANQLSSLSQLKPCYVFNGSDVVWVEEHKCQGYRLPTEAEWEYAARSKNPDTFRYPGNTLPTEVSWSKPKSQGIYHPIGVLQPNEFGIHDMSGNVWEWVWDWYGPYDYGQQKDPTGPGSGLEKIKRGGDYLFSATESTVSRRSSINPIMKKNEGIGFRLVRTIQ